MSVRAGYCRALREAFERGLIALHPADHELAGQLARLRGRTR